MRNAVFLFAMAPALALASAPAAAAQDRVLWEDLDGLTPREIGELVLADEDHREIIEVSYQAGGMRPPGTADVALVEMPRQRGEFCQRATWRTTLVTQAPARPERLGLQSSIWKDVELAPYTGVPCLFMRYTRVPSTPDPEVWSARLAQLQAFWEGDRAYICEDRTGGQLCGTDAAVRAEIRWLHPWNVREERDGTASEFWLGTRGQGPVTAVTVPHDAAAPVEIVRRYPPPF